MGLSFVARSDCMGNAKASVCGTSDCKKLPAFFCMYVEREKIPEITKVRFGRVRGRNRSFYEKDSCTEIVQFYSGQILNFVVLYCDLHIYIPI